MTRGRGRSFIRCILRRRVEIDIAKIAISAIFVLIVPISKQISRYLE